MPRQPVKLFGDIRLDEVGTKEELWYRRFNLTDVQKISSDNLMAQNQRELIEISNMSLYEIAQALVDRRISMFSFIRVKNLLKENKNFGLNENELQGGKKDSLRRFPTASIDLLISELEAREKRLSPPDKQYLKEGYESYQDLTEEGLDNWAKSLSWEIDGQMVRVEKELLEKCIAAMRKKGYPINKRFLGRFYREFITTKDYKLPEIPSTFKEKNRLFENEGDSSISFWINLFRQGLKYEDFLMSDCPYNLYDICRYLNVNPNKDPARRTQYMCEHLDSLRKNIELEALKPFSKDDVIYIKPKDAKVQKGKVKLVKPNRIDLEKSLEYLFQLGIDPNRFTVTWMLRKMYEEGKIQGGLEEMGWKRDISSSDNSNSKREKGKLTGVYTTPTLPSKIAFNVIAEGLPMIMSSKTGEIKFLYKPSDSELKSRTKYIKENQTRLELTSVRGPIGWTLDSYLRECLPSSNEIRTNYTEFCETYISDERKDTKTLATIDAREDRRSEEEIAQSIQGKAGKLEMLKEERAQAFLETLDPEKREKLLGLHEKWKKLQAKPKTNPVPTAPGEDDEPVR